MIALDALTRPLTDLLESFGPGVLPADGPPEALTLASQALDTAYAIGKLGLAELGSVWSGVAADAAAVKGEQAQTQQVALSERGSEIATVLTAASRDVGAGFAELQAIVQSFVSTAVSAGPALTTPAGQIMIVAAAIDHLSRGLAVVSRVRAELDVHTVDMTRLTGADAPVVPANAGGIEALMRPGAVTVPGVQEHVDALGGFVRHFADAVATAPSPFPEATAPAPVPELPVSTGSACLDVGSSGGVEVFLPDGSTAMAPNREAADAVRNALSQQGVPYSWGGTTPGQGLDCSGLTQWAYGEAGIDLPRTAQEQGVGIRVDMADVMPGDLAVWDGHVAMVIGGDQMVEAGDPVQVSPVRTSNLGMTFQGFYRPTA